MPSQARPNPDQASTITELSILNNYLLPPSSLSTILPYTEFLKLIPAQHRSHPHLKRLYRDLQFQRSVDVDTVRENNLRESGPRASALRAHLLGSVAAENGSQVATGGQGNSGVRKRRRDGTFKDDDEMSSSGSEVDDEVANPVVLAVNRAVESHPKNQHPAEKLLLSKPQTMGGSGTRSVYHTTASLLDAMDSAVHAIETEIEDTERQTTTMLGQMQEIVGGLSDLRYGKFDGATGRGSGGTVAGEDGGGDSIDRKVLEALDELGTATRNALNKR